MGYNENDRIYSEYIVVSADTIERSFENDKGNIKANISTNKKISTYLPNDLMYRILANAEPSRLPGIRFIMKDDYKSFTCNLKLGDKNIDIYVDVKEDDNIMSYNDISTYLFREHIPLQYIINNSSIEEDPLFNNLYQIISVWDNNIIILNLKDKTGTLIDLSKNNNLSFEIVYDKQNVFDEYHIRLSKYMDYEFKYDKFGNVDQVTKHGLLYSKRIVYYDCQFHDTYEVNTISPVPMIFNNGIEFDYDKEYMFVEHTKAEVVNGKLIDALREVYKYSRYEYEDEILED